jgi:23S rRNA (cytidine1920-2'-O)/16S rRNA (cytidine1409-2'-O)-methyltransferase
VAAVPRRVASAVAVQSANRLAARCSTTVGGSASYSSVDRGASSGAGLGTWLGTWTSAMGRRYRRPVNPRRPLIELLADRHPPIDDPFEALRDHRVLVDGVVVTNPNSQVRRDAKVVVKKAKAPKGIGKLGYALDTFGVVVEGATALDLGACTGGFTVALLERGARHVHAVDIGFGQLLGRLQQDDRVTNLERTNLAQVTPDLLGGHPDLIVVDVTRVTLGDIGAQLVANDVPRAGTELIGLVKPIFELGWGESPTTPEDLHDATRRAADGLAEHGWNELGLIESSVRGSQGAIEYFIRVRFR